MTLVTRPRSRARRAETFRLSLNPARLWRMLFDGLFLISRLRTGGRAVRLHGAGRGNQAALSIKLHAEAEAEVLENFLDFVERLAAEVLGAQHFGFGALDEIADGLDVGVLEAVVGTDAEFELFDRAVQHFVHLVQGALGGLFGGLGQLLKVDEDGHVVFEQLGGLADGVLRRDGAVGPDFDGELVVIGHLAEAGGLDGEVYFAHGRVNRIDGDVAEGQVLIVVAIGGDVATSALEAHFDIELAALADGGDGHIAVEHFDVGIGFDLAADDLAGLFDAQAGDAGAFADHLKGHLLEVEDDIGGVLDHAGDGAELVSHALDADAGDGGAFDGAEEHAAESGADGGAEAALERLGGEHAVALGERFGVGN